MPDPYAPPTTPHLGLLLPSPDAPSQRTDVARIAAALVELDGHTAVVDAALAALAAAGASAGQQMAALEQSLSGKASAADLSNKAAAVHAHAMSDTSGLTIALSGKAATDLSNVANSDFAAKAAASGVGGGGGAFSAVAAAALTAGQPVVLLADGRVEPVAGSLTPTASAATVFASGNIGYPRYAAIGHDPLRNRRVIAYRDPTAANHLRLRSYDPVSRSYGDPASVGEATTGWPALASDGAGTWVVVYGNSGAATVRACACLLNADGSISVGAPITVAAVEAYYGLHVVYDASAARWLAVYNDASNASRPTCCVIKRLSGVSISAGAPAVVSQESANSGMTLAAYYIAGDARTLVTYYDGAGASGLCRTITISDLSVSISGPSVIGSGNIYDCCLTDLGGGYCLLMYLVSNTGEMVAKTIRSQGGALSFGLPAILAGGKLGWPVLAYDAAAGRAMYFGAGASNYMQYRVVNPNIGGTPTIGGAVTVLSSGDGYSARAACWGQGASNATISVLYSNYGSGHRGEVVELSMSSTNASRFIGFSAAAGAAAGATATITALGGVVTGLSGLTPFVTYWVADDGSFIATDLGATRLAGIALSPTSLLVTRGAA